MYYKYFYENKKASQNLSIICFTIKEKKHKERISTNTVCNILMNLLSLLRSDRITKVGQKSKNKSLMSLVPSRAFEDCEDRLCYSNYVKHCLLTVLNPDHTFHLYPRVLLIINVSIISIHKVTTGICDTEEKLSPLGYT